MPISTREEKEIEQYLQAAASARHEFGPDTVELLDEVDQHGNWVEGGAGSAIDHNVLMDQLNVLQQEIANMGDVLEKSASK